MGKSKGGNIYLKGVTVRFGFDVLEPGKFKRFVKNKATGTPCGVYIHCILNISCNCMLWEVVRDCRIYISSWGFRRCSFRQTGQCESLNTWNGHQTAPRSFLYLVWFTLIKLRTLHCRSLVQQKNGQNEDNETFSCFAAFLRGGNARTASLCPDQWRCR